MNNIHSTHHSYWQSGAENSGNSLQQRYPTLETDHETEVVVIGAGITGLSTAVELLQRGFRVSVLEAEVVGTGTTGGSSGHLDAHPEQGPQAFQRNLGTDQARQAIAMRSGAIGLIEQRANAASRFVRLPAYYFSDKVDDRDALFKECETASHLGLNVTWKEEVPYPGAACGYRIDDMGRLDCLAYLQHLAELVGQTGGQIFERSFTTGPEKQQQQPLTLQVGEQTVTCQHIVCAVHCNYSAALRIDLQLPAYQSYVMAVRVTQLPPDALYWDNQTPYHYTRWAGNREDRVLMVGGYDHRTGDGDSAQAFRQLEDYARRNFQVEEVLSQWSAELFTPTDGLPLIGAVPGYHNVWIAAGFSGIGLTWGTAAGRLLGDMISGKKVPLQEQLSPSRFGWKGFATMLNEQTTALGSYAQRVLPAAQTDPRTLCPGEGKVGNVNGKFSAICQDRQHQQHRVSPICTHMGGVLRWNAAEQTWDCPVHGGRFTAEGTRLYGPPRKDLEKLAPETTPPE